jgi:glutaredoxin-like YruB-family protein
MAVVETHDSGALLETIATETKPVVVGFFADFSGASQKTRPELDSYAKRHPDQQVFAVDVAELKDLPSRFGVDEVPTVLLFSGGRVLQALVGAQDSAYYEDALTQSYAAATYAGKPGAAHRVIVYTTDTCPWCVRVKTYLRQSKVSFSEINVSRDMQAAKRMSAKSGQHGVPQLDIDGQMIVGFDRVRINALLGISGGQQQAEA